MLSNIDPVILDLVQAQAQTLQVEADSAK